MKQSLLLVSLSVLISLGGCGGGGGYSSSVTPPDTPAPPQPEPPKAPAPTVTAVSPATGSAAGGTPVTITGTDFTAATAVKFGAADAASFTVANATTINAVTPPGTGSVLITVTTANGTSTASEAGKFTYVTPPPPVAEGLWQGFTGTDQAIGGLVRPQAAGGGYWLVYSSASTPAPDSVTAANAAGFIRGTGTETITALTEGSFSSNNLAEFNFAGIGQSLGSLTAGYVDKAKFGKALAGAGEGMFSSTPASSSPTTLSNGTSDTSLPLPGLRAMSVAASSVVSGTADGSGTATGVGLLGTGNEFVFTATGRTTTSVGGGAITTDTINTQVYALQGSLVGGTFQSPTSGEAEVTACTNNGGNFNGCLAAGPGSISVFETLTGSVSLAAGGTLNLIDSVGGPAVVTTTLNFAPAALAMPTTPANPTFSDGGTPWTISYAGTPVLSGSLHFAPYSVSVDLQNGVTATLDVPARVLAVNGTQGTLTYDAGTNTLRLANATFTDTSGNLGCTGDATICGAGAQPTTLPSTVTTLSGDVVIAIDTPSTGQYQAQLFIGGQSNPISTLTFDGDLSSAPTVTVNFTTDYLASYETAPTLAAVQGNRSGSAGVHSAIQPGASFSIDAAGALTGGMEASGCTYTGTVAPAAKGNVYEVALTFTSGNSCTYSGPFTGVAFFDENGKLTITATNADQDEGFLFIEQ